MSDRESIRQNIPHTQVVSGVDHRGNQTIDYGISTNMYLSEDLALITKKTMRHHEVMILNVIMSRSLDIAHLRSCGEMNSDEKHQSLTLYRNVKRD